MCIRDRALKEVLYHQDHAAVWLNRLGLGTEESARRMQAGLDELWPYVGELFYDDENTAELAGQGIAVLPSSLKEPTLERITRAITEAGLEVPTSPTARGLDRSGATSEWRGYILAEMQVLARRYPEAQW